MNEEEVVYEEEEMSNDIYTDTDDMVDNDEISVEEQGFMNGYNASIDDDMVV